jgi:hypothetical protein
MSNYSKTVNFAAKDALVTGNPAKAGKGTEIDTEFNNIATAIATKQDASNAAVKDADNAFSTDQTVNGNLIVTGNATSGWSKYAAKSATTSRNSTTSRTDDPHLVLSSLSAGTWAFEAQLFFYSTSSDAGGVSMSLAFSGTTSSAFRTAYGTIGGPFWGASAITSAVANTSSSSNSTAPAWEILKGFLVVTVAGNLSVQWAQFSSDANNLNLLAGSYITARRVA